MTPQQMIDALLDNHESELTPYEVEAFTDMRRLKWLSPKQTAWIQDRYESLVAQNWVSNGVVPRGKEVELLVKDKPLRPPQRRNG